jgi:hypothetical protein
MLEKQVFIICPVRGATEEENEFLRDYVSGLEMQGYKVHFPPRDTNQTDPTGGYRICSANCAAIRNASEVHIYWTKKSQGTLFDIGISFDENQQNKKPIRLINRKDVESIVNAQKSQGVGKSFEQVLLRLDSENPC